MCDLCGHRPFDRMDRMIQGMIQGWIYPAAPRPDLKAPPNRAWLGLDKVLPPPPEYFPDRELEFKSR